jgi:hypothetical protein
MASRRPGAARGLGAEEHRGGEARTQGAEDQNLRLLADREAERPVGGVGTALFLNSGDEAAGRPGPGTHGDRAAGQEAEIRALGQGVKE